MRLVYDETNLKQGAHIHQLTPWPVPHACAKPYHPGSCSRGQLFRLYWGSSAGKWFLETDVTAICYLFVYLLIYFVRANSLSNTLLRERKWKEEWY